MRFLFFFCCFLLSSLGVYFSQVIIRPSDRISYQKMINRPKHTRKHTLARDPIAQLRKGTKKEVWLSHPQKRDHIVLFSDFSDLILEERNGKLDMIEQLNQFVCSDGITKLTAQKGFYSYRSRKMDLDGGISLLIPKQNRTLLLSAQKAEIAFEQGGSFNCSRFLAQGSVAMTSSEPFTVHGDSLEYDPLQKKITLQASEYCSFSYRGETFAIAPCCSYFRSSSTAFLESLSPFHRVLFWEKDHGRSLSAPALQIKIDSNRSFNEMHALGDVHCTLDNKEKTLIEKFFGEVL